MDRLRHWWRVIRAGWRAPVAVAGYLVLVVGGSVALAIPWARRHLLWGLLVVAAVAVIVLLEGSHQESRRSEAEHEVALGKARVEHQSELNKALTAAVSASGKPDPVDWLAHASYAPPETSTTLPPLAFFLRHRFSNVGAVMAFSEFRCTVIDPGGVTVVARGLSSRVVAPGYLMDFIADWVIARFSQSYFPGAPPVRSGSYAYTWEAMDAKGTWHRLGQGSYEVSGVPAEAQPTQPAS